jgi:4-alpha-glucanotransferase
MNSDTWGVFQGFENAHHQWVETPVEIRRAVHQAMGVEEADHAQRSPAVHVLTPRTAPTWRQSGTLHLEDGATVAVRGALPADLPYGYHRFETKSDEAGVPFIYSPGVCHVPAKKGWGWSCQLYATRSTQSWGIGDFADLARLGQWSRQLGAAFVQVNPLHAVAPVLPQENSPYSPSSRRYRNPIYLRIEQIPAAGELSQLIEPLARRARALNDEPLLDRDSVYRLKLAALEALWAAAKGSLDQEYVQREGQALEEFAVYSVLAEQHGRDWRRWPADCRRPTRALLDRVHREHGDRVRFFQWLQWLADQQLDEAASNLPIMQDLPVGFDPGGADAWAWQDLLALDAGIGAPPDIHNTQGQNWGLPPWIPHKLQAAGYRPFVETIRATLAHAGGLRIDHALGMFRQYWVPNGFPPSGGAFVKYPHADLLAIIALESHRSGAFIVAEDLGTTEPTMREELARAQMLSTRLLWFEKEPPAEYPDLSLAAITTHDLPTVAGLLSGQDHHDQLRAGLRPDPAADQAIRDQVREFLDLPVDASLEQTNYALHDLLASANSRLLAATLEDALLLQPRVNMPTSNSWPNWRQALPVPLEQLETHPQALQLARILQQRRTTDVRGR